MTMAHTMSTTTKTMMPPTFTSLVSRWTSGEWFSIVLGFLRGAFDQRAERLVEFGVVHRKNRATAELPDEAAKPDRAERQRKQHVEPADRDAVAMEFRRNEPEQIDYTSQQH